MPRQLNSYMRFVKANWPSYKKKYPNLKATEIMRKIASAYRAQ